MRRAVVIVPQNSDPDYASGEEELVRFGFCVQDPTPRSRNVEGRHHFPGGNQFFGLGFETLHYGLNKN